MFDTITIHLNPTISSTGSDSRGLVNCCTQNLGNFGSPLIHIVKNCVSHESLLQIAGAALVRPQDLTTNVLYQQLEVARCGGLAARSRHPSSYFQCVSRAARPLKKKCAWRVLCVGNLGPKKSNLQASKVLYNTLQAGMLLASPGILVYPTLSGFRDISFNLGTGKA